MEKEYTVSDPSGIHARPAGLLVALFKECKSSIKVMTDTKTVDGKSILGIMSLGVKQGGKLRISAEGEDEKSVFEKIEKFSSSQKPPLFE